MTTVLEEVSSLQRVAIAVTDAQLFRVPSLRARYGASGRQRCIEDTVFHLTYLSQAAELGDQSLFDDYVAWAKLMLISRGVGADDLEANLREIATALRAEPEEAGKLAAIRTVEAAITRLPSMPGNSETLLGGDGPLRNLARSFLDSIRKGQAGEAVVAVRAALENGTRIAEIYEAVFEPVQHEIRT